MDAEERARRFAAAAKKQVEVLPRIQRDVLGEIVRQLDLAKDSLIESLQLHPSASAQRRLRALKIEVEQALAAYREAVTQSYTQGVESAWTAGVQNVTQPFAAAGVNLSVHVDTRLLMAAEHFMTTRIEDISLRAINQLNSALTQHLIGTRSLTDTVTDVQRILGGAPRWRAMTIAYTEIGRAHAISQDEALHDAGEIVPGLRKRWLKSGKVHARASHVAANNQIRRYDEAYLVDGEHLRFPRDPNGSAGNTINCGCHSIPVVDGSSFGAGTVRIDDSGAGHIATADGRRIKLPE